jgi:XTP/dITP diphosphohydrolase
MSALAGRRVVLATRNAHKLRELRRILAAADLGDADVVGADGYPELPAVAETGDSFEANALLKARAVCDATGQLAIADDSGLAVDALCGMPGIFSARWSGDLVPPDQPAGRDAANLRLVLAQLADVPDERRGAAFVCAAVLVAPDGTELVAHGTVRGVITHSPRGGNGFGYDPIFELPERGVTTAELSDDEKDAISHRGRALRTLVEQIKAKQAQWKEPA